jgi:Arc/MetJ family transcription regulator
MRIRHSNWFGPPSHIILVMDVHRKSGRLLQRTMCIYGPYFYTLSDDMRTNIEIDDELIAAAMRATGQSTKRGTVEEALRRVVASYRRLQAIEDMAGLGWEGDLDAMRSGRKR